MKKISVIIPCYNEEESIRLFDQELSQTIEKMDSYTFEVIYIDDGSKDHTLSCIRELAKKRNYVRYLSFSRNFGKEAAMYAGFSNAKGNYIAVMDADLQDPPALLMEMADILEQGVYDSVATRRVDREGEPPIRSFFARSFYKVINKITSLQLLYFFEP